MKLFKKGLYYLVPQFAAEKLHLESGALRDIYCIILGFSQDGESSCACTVQYFMEWTGASERQVRLILKALSDAGYVTKKRIGSGPGSYVEYRANMEIVESCQMGAEYAPIEWVQKSAKMGAEFDKMGAENAPIIPIAFTRDNNKIIIYNNIFLSRKGAKEARKKENIFEFFFWKNAEKPLAEAEAFIRTAEVAGWKDSSGRDLDTQRKVIAWADGWEIRNGTVRVNPAFLLLWNKIYSWLVYRKDPAAEMFLNPQICAEVTPQDLCIHLPSPVMEWLEQNVVKAPEDEPTRRLLKEFLAGRKLSYIPFVL